MKRTFFLQKTVFGFLSHVRWTGWLHPFWFVFFPSSFQLKGRHYREVEALIQRGDILIERFDGYVSTWLIPGWWNHAGIYVGTYREKPHQVIHAIGYGVVVTDLIDFMRTDHLIVLRMPNDSGVRREQAVRSALAALGFGYDWAFDFGNTVRFCCTELVAHCYPSLKRRSRERWGRFTITADDIVERAACGKNDEPDALEIIWTSERISRNGHQRY